MIKGIYNGGRYIQVNNGSPSWPSIYNQSYGNSLGGQSFTGSIRYNNGNMEIFDGTNWQGVGTSVAQVGLTAEAESLLDWVNTQRTLELNRRQLIANNPALQKAYEAVKRAEENFDLLAKFVESDKENV